MNISAFIIFNGTKKTESALNISNRKQLSSTPSPSLTANQQKMKNCNSSLSSFYQHTIVGTNIQTTNAFE